MSNRERDGQWTEDRLVADVEQGPQGPQVGAFFDFDGTLIDGYSFGTFARHHLRSMHVTPGDVGRLLLIGMRGVTTEADFERFFVLGMRAWTGRSEDELVELGERLFVQGIARSLYPEAWRLVEAHRRAGHTVVLASSATRFQVEPAARAMGVEHILVTPVGFENGICTGRPGGPPLWRAGKAAAVREFAPVHGIDLAASYAYSNGDEDVPFLETVGRPRALNPGRGLAAQARARGWPVARFRSRNHTGVTDVVRTAAGVGGMLGGFGAGLVTGLVAGGSRRDGVDLGITLAGDLGAALAGVHVDVEGAEHLAARPAVIVFNHQSQLDVLVLAKLLRGGFTGVAKKELATMPGFGLAFRLMDVAFVDRADGAQARKALEPAVQRLRDGISLVIAPEGTRSATPALGPFKKGAFHVAMQAGVPILPVVIRNAGELMWRDSSTIRPGTVQVRVLAPVPTDGWTVATLDDHVADVRARFVDALAQWRPTVHEVQVATGPAGPVPDAPLDWGTAPEMNPLETAMWRAEVADPRLRANATMLELLDTAPDWERFRAAHEWASRMVPRMRQKVVEPALGLGAPTWVTVASLDLDAHVHHRTLPAPGSQRQMLDAAAEFAGAPLDRDRPPWRALLVDGLAGGGAAYVTVIHHSATDALGWLQLISKLHRDHPEPDPARPEPPVPDPGFAVPSALLTGQVSRTVTAVPGEVLRQGAGLLGALTHPVATLSRAAAAVRTVGGAAVAPSGSPLLAPRGGPWRFDVLDLPLAALRAGAKAAGGSVNDGLLAAVIGGFRRYHELLGAQPGDLPIGFPISLRREDDPQGGNRFTGARLVGSMAEKDPVERIRVVREFVLSARANPDVLGLLGPVMEWLPAPVVGAVSGRLSSANDVQVSNVPGLPHEVYMAGARITRMYPFGPLPGCAVMLTLLSHAGTACIGINSDGAAVTEPDELVACLAEGLAEIVALA
ncbi:HAD-IB family hydrolase [Pseudonocardia sp.]|uniref:HAD-IB family hydrolase n=1 Tax=Pseudonocardia sp. TaxID=60912 RepID=UPI003D14A7BA